MRERGYIYSKETQTINTDQNIRNVLAKDGDSHPKGGENYAVIWASPAQGVAGLRLFNSCDQQELKSGVR
jgi:hypothetical protein